MLPLARSKDLVVKKMSDETLIYDRSTDKVHSLNTVAALIWKHCDGRNGIDDFVNLIQSQLHLPANVASVELALEQLSKRNLLDKPLPTLSISQSNERREMLKALAAALALPIIMSVTAPKALAQVSPRSGGGRPTGTSTGTTNTGTTTTGTPPGN